MSKYDFIIENIRFSYSSTGTYTTCPHAFRLSYIDVVPRKGNFFAEFGTLVHECFEKYFNNHLESYELSEYYKNNFELIVRSPAPPPDGMAQRYYEQGLEFFNNFSFPKDDYEVLLVEDKIDFERDGILFVAKPDLVLKNKKTGEISLYDYKTATPYRIDKRTGLEIADLEKIKGYHKQLYIYTYALRVHRNMPIDYITLWYPRLNRLETITWDSTMEEEVMASIDDIVKHIYNEETFPFNNSNSYFCENLCGVRDFCEYR